MKRRSLKQRLRANEIWQQNMIALARDTESVTSTQKGSQMELTPVQRAERDAYYQGVRMLEGFSKARAEIGQDPLTPDWSQAPDSVKAERRNAKQIQEAESEAARINERTRELQLENARLEGEIKGRSERKAA